MIRLYKAGETNFDHNDYVLSECIRCIVTETTGGILDLEMEYLLKDSKNISGLLVRGNIIKCPISTTDSRGEQLFKIRTVTPNTSNTVIKIYAQAIARRDLDKFNMVIDLRTTPGATRKQAMQEILSHCAKAHKFYIGNLDTNTFTNINMGMNDDTGEIINYLTINGISPRSAFLSESENSIYKAFGGEIIYNNFEINMVDERGTDNSFEIRSGKNLQELEQSIDDTDLDNFVTAIIPVSSDGVYLPNHEIIYSPNHSILEGGFLKLVCDDVSLVENTQAGFDVVYAQLRSRVQKKFNEGIDKLKINNTVKFVQLSNTEEYKDYKILEKCEIGNNVIVKYYDPFDQERKIYIEAVGRVLKIQFNVLTNRIEEVEIGDRKKENILATINSTVNAAKDLNKKHNDNKVKIKKAKAEAIKYTDDTKESLIKFIGETETGILLEVKKADDSMSARIELTEKEILSTVKKDEFSSYIKQNYNSIVQAIIDATGTHTCTFSGDGLEIKNGGFKIVNSKDQVVLWMDTKGYIKVTDLIFDNEAFAEGSNFFEALANMEKVTLANLGVNGKFTIHDTDFYIYYNGEGGYDLKNYVETVCYKMLQDQGLI